MTAISDFFAKVQVGTRFERIPVGWQVRWVDGGTVIHQQGATVQEALANGGVVIDVPPVGETLPEPPVEVPPTEEVPPVDGERPPLIAIIPPLLGGIDPVEPPA